MLNGLRHGLHGKHYDEAGNLIYDGTYEHNFATGQGTLYLQNNGCFDGSRYIGQIVNGQREGYGEYFDENGTLRYSGQYKNSERHGYGKYYDKAGTLVYDGQYEHGVEAGHGTLYFR